MAKHAATPPQIRVAERIAPKARHAAYRGQPATRKSPAEIEAALRDSTPANVGGDRSPRPTPGGSRQTRKPTRYVGKNALYTPRSSRTRYIRYLGNDDVHNTSKLVGEWIGGVVLICIAVPTQAANNGYVKTITKIMYRLTALTAVFFVLALLADTKAGKAAVYLGLLIDLGIVFDAVHSGTLKGVANIMSGKSILQSGTTLAADVAKPVDDFPGSGGMIQGLDLTNGGTQSNAPVSA